MAKRSDYRCVIYEKGDKITARYGNGVVYEVEDTELKFVGEFPVLFLKFVNKEQDITHTSNLYIPAEETIEKYKDGFKYYNNVTVNIVNKISNKGNMVIKQTAKKEKAIQLQIEEELPPIIVKSGIFKTKPQ